MMHALLQRSLREALRARPDTETVGPFLAAFDPDSDSPFRNYAVPDDDARPTRDEVEHLRRAFLGRERLPRLEFLPAAAPAVLPALLSAGFVADARLPIMTCTESELRATPPGACHEVAIVAERETLREAAAVQNAAYDAPQPGEADIARLQRTIADGGSVAIARNGDGDAIGSGLVSAPADGLAELAAVGVLPAWRRRGVAAALTSALAGAAFDGATETLMLMAYEAEMSIYARAGFSVATKIAFVSALTSCDG
jgi:GNAT superfamily N-acetyltransferase